MQLIAIKIFNRTAALNNNNNRAAIRLKILIAINRTIKISNSILIAPEQETQVCGTE